MATRKGNQEQVTLVISAKIEILEEDPKQALITATGQVPTLGWSDPALVPYVYIQPPPDGIYDFDFVATPPEDPAGQALSRVTAKEVIVVTPDLKGVRIHSATNSLEALLMNGGGSQDT